VESEAETTEPIEKIAFLRPATLTGFQTLELSTYSFVIAMSIFVQLAGSSQLSVHYHKIVCTQCQRLKTYWSCWPNNSILKN
jgi:hypothetical protein